MGSRRTRRDEEEATLDSDGSQFEENAYLAARGLPPLDLPKRGPADMEEEPDDVTKVAAVNGEPKRNRSMHAKDLGVKMGKNYKALAVAIPQKRARKAGDKAPAKSLAFSIAIPDYEGSKPVLNVEFRSYPVCVCHLIDPIALSGWVSKDCLWGGVYDHQQFLPGTGQAAVHLALEERLQKPVPIAGMFVEKRALGPSQHAPFGKAGVRPVVIPADAAPSVWIPLIKKAVYMPPDERVHGLQVEEYRRAARNDLYYMEKSNMERRLAGKMRMSSMLDMTQAYVLPKGILGEQESGKRKQDAGTEEDAVSDDASLDSRGTKARLKEASEKLSKLRKEAIASGHMSDDEEALRPNAKQRPTCEGNKGSQQKRKSGAAPKGKQALVIVSDSDEEDSVFVNSPPRAPAQLANATRAMNRQKMEAMDEAGFLKLLRKYRRTLYEEEREEDGGQSSRTTSMARGGSRNFNSTSSPSSASGGRHRNIPPRPSATAAVVLAPTNLPSVSRLVEVSDTMRCTLPPRVEGQRSDTTYSSVVTDFYSLPRAAVPVASEVATTDWEVGDLAPMTSFDDTTPVVLAIAAAAEQHVLAAVREGQMGTGGLAPIGVQPAASPGQENQSQPSAADRRCSIDLNRRMS